MSRKRSLLLGAGALVVVAVVIFGRGGDSGPSVELAPVEDRDVFRSYVTASGEILAENYADIGSNVMGSVVELPVEEGQRVERGELLARIDPIQARSDLDAAEAAIRALQADAVSAREQVSASRADLELAQAQAREATLNRQRLEALFEQEVIAAAEVDTARARADSGAAQVAAAEAALARSRSGFEAAQKRVAQALAQAGRARDIVEKTAIVAPISGVVSSLQVRAGEMVVIGIQNQPGTVLMTVSDLSELNAEVQVAEADVLRVAVGQSARVTLEALPERTFEGVVTEVGASALPQQGAGAAAREFRVEIRLKDPDVGLRPGLTCDAEILVGEQRDVTVVPLQAVVLRSSEDGTEERGVFTVNDGAAEFVPVETGIIGGLDIEVSGVAVGTEVIVGPYQVLRELQDGQAVGTR